MNVLLGRSANLALYGNNEHAVVFDTELDLVLASGAPTDLLSLEPWEPGGLELSSGQIRLCDLSLDSFKVQSMVASSGKRMYSIPDGVQKEAKKALEWRKEHKRGGTPVGLNTARTLARGGQIGIEKVRHIAKYFPRHEVDKKGKGWAPGEDNFPSNGRIAWALWGGDAAQRWASAIVERESQSLTASASDVDPFRAAYELEDGYGPEFMVRVSLDGTGIDRLYKIEANGDVCVWDDNNWDDLGNLSGNVWSHDRDLDGKPDGDVTHVLIDIDSALQIAAKLGLDPFTKVTVEELNEDEALLAARGMPEEDWELVDRVMSSGTDPMTAAGTTDPTGGSKADADGDGKLDPSFLSDKAENQPRDASGKFVKVGSRTIVAGDSKRGSGTIDSIDYQNDKINVRLDSGKMIAVNSKYLSPEADSDGPRMLPTMSAPLDLSGILGEPRTPAGSSVRLSGTLPPLGTKEINEMMNNWGSWVKKQRDYKLFDDSDIPKWGRGKGIKNIDRKYMKKRYGMEMSNLSLLSAGTNSEEKLTPETADVIQYLVVVSPDDLGAVMDLIAIVPDTATTTTPVVYSRKDGKWVQDDQTLKDLKSPAPPPVIKLDKAALEDVMSQMDGKDKKLKAVNAAALVRLWFSSIGDINTAILAAGGLDRNRGNAESLRRYWTHGKGAAKIRWGTPGDWTRCVRQLSKYMGPRAKGYCQLRHKEATGVYTGSRFNPGKKQKSFSSLYESDSMFTDQMIEKARLSALAADARQKVALVAAAAPIKQGASFSIPMLVPEEVESGDGRKFKNGAITVRDLPVPLLWQIKTGSGHDGSVVVGRIDYVERIEGGMGNAYGVFDTGPYGREAERLVRSGFLRGVSVDLDQFEAKEDKKPKEEMAEDDGQSIGKDKLTINKARIMAATIVAKPAFQECSILLQNEGDQEDNVTPEDGVYEESMQDFADVEPILASGFLKADIPLTPPADWFEHPSFSGPTPLTVDDNGRVYGHIAAWNVNHIGLPRATKPPRSRSKYAYFHTGVVRTENGTDVPVGQLTLAGGHAPLNADAVSAAKHYDDTASAVADIHVGEDEYGIWCAGSLRPNLDEMQIRALRASAPSGDWRPINGSLELVAICQVNVPGFPTARAMIASGKVLALVAAGASYMAMMRCSGAACALSTKAEMLGELAASAPNLKIRVREAKKALRASTLQAMTASAADLREKTLTAAAVAELAKISEDERMELAKEGKAMPDGAYPIRNVEDLKNAIQAYGRAKASERRAVRKHITKQARKLKQESLIPDQWKNADSMEAAERVASMRVAITAAADSPNYETTPAYIREVVVAAGPKVEEISDEDLKKLRKVKEEADKQTEEEIAKAEDIKAGKTTAPDMYDKDGRQKYVSGVNQPRDAKGKYRKVLARLKQDLGVAGLAKALQKAEEAENLDFAGDYEASAKASSELLDTIDRLDVKALNPESLENVRLSAKQLGTAIANLPLPFGKDAEKLKFSDLPAGLKDLIEQMISRVEAKIGKKDADIATQSLKSYMSGADVYSQGEIQSEMSKLLRLLT